MLTDFRRRALLYSNWDGRLAGRTRFFGAAAVTNAALDELFGLGSARLFLSCATASFLSEVGAVLETLNLDLASQLALRPWPGGDFDAYMIHSEQTAVEIRLRELKRSNCASHRQIVKQINRLLEHVRSAVSFESLFPYAAYYAQILRAASCELGRPTDFSVQSDRELIGHTLIVQLIESQNTPSRDDEDAKRI